jgi:rod shape determining protein RodA
MFKNFLKNATPALVFIPLILTFIGIIFILSADMNANGTNNGLYLKQLLWIVIGFVIAYFIINIDYFILVETSLYYYIAGLILLVITLLIGKNIRGHRSWMGFAGLGIQPSEIMKVCYILFFAKYLANAPILEKKARVFFASLGILAVPLLLILLQPDFATSGVYIFIFLVMSFLGMADTVYIKYILVTGAATIFVFVVEGFYKVYLLNGGVSNPIIETLFSSGTFFVISIVMFLYTLIIVIIEFFQSTKISKKMLPVTTIIGISCLILAVAFKFFKPYMWNRIMMMFSPEFDKSGAGYNIIQSKIAIGSGGFFGRGLFQGTQNILGFLPEKSTDFIYSIICEELGFIGGFLILLLFGIYFYYINRTIQNAKDKEGMLVASGILAMLFIHLFINVGMTLGLIPVAGIPLPFISYGGSCYLGFIVAAALILNINIRRFVH